jgi:phenylacetic acid degradation operon negative regulatory protein
MLLRNTFKKKFLLFLSLAADFWFENFSFYSSRHPYLAKSRKETVYSTVSRLLSVGEIEKIVKGDKIYLRLTSKGFNKLKEDVPLFKYSRQKWDGYWRMVIFDIPEEKRVFRDVLRQKLVSLGLAKWQRSIYITPFPLEEEINQFLKTKNIFGFAFCLKAKRLGRGDDRQIAKSAFKLDKLNREYHQLIEEDLEQARFLLGKGRLKANKVQQLVNKYLALIQKDPGLPQELLPEAWWAEEAKKEFKDFILKLKTSSKNPKNLKKPNKKAQ